MTTKYKAPRSLKKKNSIWGRLIIIVLVVSAIIGIAFVGKKLIEGLHSTRVPFKIPEFSGEPYVVINDNVPFFTKKDKKSDTFESYGKLDELGRCSVAFANITRKLMPTGERGEIGSIKPSGWKQAKYEGLVDSNPPYLYNRCHLIAYCLTAENANKENLITGTRYLNVEGMLPFELKVAKYLDANDNHVLYRATPVFEGENLVASGVLLEAYSIEDEGEGICFCVYCFNVQPGVTIDYRTGDSEAGF